WGCSFTTVRNVEMNAPANMPYRHSQTERRGWPQCLASRSVNQMKRMLSVLTIACGPLLSVSRAEEAQAPPAPAIIAGFLGFSDIQAARFAQLLGGLRASVGLQDFMEALVSLLKQTPVDESRVMSQLDKI